MMFNDKLSFGKVGESYIANWFKKKGYNVLPVYEVEAGQYKGPVVYCQNGDKLIAPDMIVFNRENIIWIEAKHKKGFPLNRMRGKYVVGINKDHFNNYLEVAKLTDWPFWLIFLVEGGKVKDSPINDSGLYGLNIRKAKDLVDHESDKTDMVYWLKDDLRKLDDI